MKTLEAGKLYQLKQKKGWIIAEYVKPVPAHSYKYRPFYLDPKIEVGPEKVCHVPDSHAWRTIRAGTGSIFNVEDRGMEIRPVTEDAIAEIARLRQEINQLENDWLAKKKELREFCE